ncbi:Wall-associated receptor kinase 2 [Dichanthelium oligosanthes]|uniref:Wall-associated receptor kinase 2 n=1 Tax=Dichanthelium oligosanthes TaxID=888268 RepID=A0A1E5V518_9POAL|nr:Wall-associated receptor kinase 2 [Dichanthelium oligosanthes]
MSMFSAAFLLLLLLQAAAAAAAALAAAPAPAQPGSNCTTRCGNTSIPYPFGVEPGCYLPGFDVTCSDDVPPRLHLHGIRYVFDINLPNGTVGVYVQSVDVSIPGSPTQCGDYLTDNWDVVGVDIDRGPFSLSATRNKLVVIGCDVQVLLMGLDEDIISTCAAFCSPVAKNLYMVASPDCSGIGCCQAPIPAGLNVYLLQFRRFNGSWSGHQATVYVVDADRLSSYAPMDTLQATALPAVLEWVISKSPCQSNSTSPECRSSHSFCQNSTTFDVGHRCHCSQGYDGNPYILDGCTDINECEFPEIYPCFGDCKNTVGGYLCQCPLGFEGNASLPKGCRDVDECVDPEAHSCYGICKNLPGSFQCQCRQGTYGDPTTKGGCITIKNSISGSKIALVVSGCFILLLVALAAPFITRKIQLQRVKRLKEKFFKQNHGLLLEQLVSQNTDIGERMIISLREIEKATGNFDKTREVGGGGHGVVYKGILNLHVVAIKKSKIVVQREIDDFINEVAILSQVNHRNVVKLLGCCLETEVPLLVYEFISNGTLYDHLHVEGPISLSWDDRLRIVLEVARALSYLHSATSMPIYHRDIKSSNVLLDDSLTAKVSDFGASRYIPIDQTGVNTAIQGTFGYLDPVYYYTGRLTDKSDVFSFGVLVMELLTRKKPFIYRSDDGDSLVSHFDSQFGEGKLGDIIDPQVMREDNGLIQEVAALAVMCTKLKGEDRPTMREVELILENLHVKTHAPICGTPCNRDYIPAQVVTQEVSRQYTIEKEIMLSATYPR